MLDTLPTILDERLGQYRLRRTALYHARMYQLATGRTALVVKTRTYRDLEPRKCWTVVFG